jgi:hypothetical protein
MGAAKKSPAQPGSLHADLQSGPRTVQGAKLVNLAMVSWTDENGRKLTQLAVVGDNTVHLLEGKGMGFSSTTTPQGMAKDWLKEAIFNALQSTSV